MCFNPASICFKIEARIIQTYPNKTMPFFTLLSLSMSYLVYYNNPLLEYLLLPALLPIAGFAVVISSIAILWNKILFINWHEMFISSSLLVWFSYWHQFFKADAPMFFFFPLFLALVTAMVHLFVIRKRHYFDDETIAFMQRLEESTKLQPIILIVIVVASFFLREHYLLFPTALTLFLFKYAIRECLKNDE